VSSFDFEPLDLLDLFGGGSSDWSFGSASMSPAKTGTLTPQQTIALLLAQQQKGKGKKSFLSTLKGIGKGAANPVLWSFDKLLRPNYGIASAVQAGLRGEDNGFDVGDALHGFREGFMGRNKIGFGEVLRDHNKGGIPWLQGLAGFGLDVATDPLTYLTLGTTGVAKGATAGALKAVGSELPAQLTKEAGTKALFDLGTAIKQLESLGPKYAERAALGKQKASIVEGLLNNADSPLRLSDSWMEDLSVARARAAAESKLYDPRKVQLQWRIPGTGKSVKLTPGKEFGKFRLGSAPAGLEGAVKALNLPGMASLGRAFKPGYEAPIEYASALSKRHIGERLTDDYMKALRDRFGRTQAIDEDSAVDVVSFFEKHGDDVIPSVIKQGDDYVLNPAKLEEARAAGFTDDQLEFVQAIHDITRSFAKKHVERGIDFESKDFARQGRFYMPHIVKKTGKPLNDVQRNLLSQRGFLKKRHLDLTMKQIRDLSAKGKLPVDIETNPYKVMTRHARSVANQHADQALINHLSKTHGVPKRIVNEEELLGNNSVRQETQAKLDRINELLDKKGPAVLNSYAKHVEKLKQDTVKQYRAAIRDNEAAIRAHLNGPWKQTTMATVKRLSNYNVRLKERLKAELEAIDSGAHKGLKSGTKDMFDAVKTMEKERVKLEAAIKSLNKRERKLLQGEKNPAYSAKKHTTIDKLKDEYGFPLAVPHEIHNEITRLQTIVAANDETLEAWTRGYRRWLGKWKLAVTSLNVGGYGMRNTLSDFWNMYLAGVPMAQSIRFGGKAAAIMRAAKHGDEKALRELNQAYDAGVLSGLFAGDVQQVTDMLEHAGSKRALVKNKRFIALTSKVTQDINRNRENWGRLTHYLYRRHNGASVEEAAEWVRKAHFDYEELTPFEQEKLKLVAPFYTWSRKNIPYQIESMVKAPGRMAAFPKFAMEMDAAAGGSEGETIPEYMQRGMFLKMPGGKYAAPMIGVTDLMRATNPVEGAKSLLTPAVKVPMELLMNRNMLTGGEIQGKHSRNPVNDALAPLLSLIPGSNVGPTARTNPATGEVARGTGIDPQLSHILGLTPLTNLLFNQSGKIKTQQRGGDANKPLISWLTGINLNAVDPAQQNALAAMEFQELVDQMIQDLRDSGLFPMPEKRKPSSNQRLIDTTLLNAQRG
jgi:hypothetical protein